MKRREDQPIELRSLDEMRQTGLLPHEREEIRKRISKEQKKRRRQDSRLRLTQTA